MARLQLCKIHSEESNGKTSELSPTPSESVSIHSEESNTSEYQGIDSKNLIHRNYRPPSIHSESDGNTSLSESDLSN